MASKKVKRRQKIEEAAAGLGCTVVLFAVVGVIAIQAMSTSQRSSRSQETPSASPTMPAVQASDPLRTVPATSPSNNSVGRRPSDAPDRSTAFEASPGDEGRIRGTGGTPAFGASTLAAYDELVKAASIGDRGGMEALVSQGRLVALDTGTRVLVLHGFEYLASLMRQSGSDGVVIQVRALDGRHSGRAVWVAKADVGSP